MVLVGVCAARLLKPVEKHYRLGLIRVRLSAAVGLCRLKLNTSLRKVNG